MADTASKAAPMRAVTFDNNAPSKFVLREFPRPTPGPGVPVIKVASFSLNRGEVRTALTNAQNGARFGWDIAGTIAESATDGAWPPAGTRVVALDPGGGWAEFSAVPTPFLATLPDSVSFAQAATLPVAGLTSLHALARGGDLSGKRVLINGARGGVGSVACQIARHMGAHVVAAIRDEGHEAFVRSMGADTVAVGANLSGARAHAPFHLILDSVGGASLGAALTMLAPGGTCVLFGVSESETVTFDAGTFYRTGGATLYGVTLRHEFQREMPAAKLAQLVAMTAEGKLKAPIELEASWTEVADIARKLISRDYSGKAVLRI
ncbi:MAG TPA: zinc-binding dehydrogenase [Candidatus Binataceae bacterium]|nr:zinc-binding dehydrogenase [Candidatus Binataceae bacterium]